MSRPPKLILTGFAVAGLAAAGLLFADRIVVNGDPAPAVAPAALSVEVLAEFHHETDAFTQGLLLHEGKFYESTGLYGRSSLRRVDPPSGAVEMMIDVPEQYFAEGLALVGDRLYQLTWRAGVCFVYDVNSFDQVGEFRYEGQGWGLDYDGEHLVMSDGSAELEWRDPDTFEVQRSVTVTRNGQPVVRLNELEVVGEHVYANVWQTDEIIQIDAATGEVVGVIDAADLLAPEDRQGVDVLNGIAHDAETDTFFITGKLWPRMFQVNFVPAE